MVLVKGPYASLPYTSATYHTITLRFQLIQHNSWGVLAHIGTTRDDGTNHIQHLWSRLNSYPTPLPYKQCIIYVTLPIHYCLCYYHSCGTYNCFAESNWRVASSFAINSLSFLSSPHMVGPVSWEVETEAGRVCNYIHIFSTHQPDLGADSQVRHLLALVSVYAAKTLYLFISPNSAHLLLPMSASSRRGRITKKGNFTCEACNISTAYHSFGRSHPFTSSFM